MYSNGSDLLHHAKNNALVLQQLPCVDADVFWVFGIWRLQQWKPYCERVMCLYITVHIIGPGNSYWPVDVLLQTSNFVSVFPPPTPMLHLSMVLEVVLLNSALSSFFQLVYKPRILGLDWSVVLGIG